MIIPDKITSGNPPKEFAFTGEWSEQTVGGRNCAARNRRVVWYPIYKAADGERICPAWLLAKKNPIPSAVGSE